MNNENTNKIRGTVELLLESSSRINEAKPQKYWHPLAQATYGIDEIMEALDSMVSFRTTMWEKTALFEERFAFWQGRKHAIMVNSGSSADLLMCYGLLDPARPILKPGDEILVPVVTWPTQIWSPMMAGLNVKLVDVSSTTLNVTAKALLDNVTENTKAIFLVHLMGLPCHNLSFIRDFATHHDLVLLEDCCEALGSTWNGRKVGNFGLAASFSFFFAHGMTTMEGGMIVTDDDDFARQLRIMRAHGWLRNVKDNDDLAGYTVDPRYAFVDWGFNLRPTELQAAFGLHQIGKVDNWNFRRHEMAASFYAGMLRLNSHLAMPEYDPEHAWPSWFALPVMVKQGAPFTRDELTAYLERAGVETRPIVTGNVARHPVSKLFPQFQYAFPGADEIHNRGFYVGLSPLTTNANLELLIDLFRFGS